MNEKAERLGELSDMLRNVGKEYGDILAKEPTIARPLNDAAAEANRRFKSVSEAHGPEKS